MMDKSVCFRTLSMELDQEGIVSVSTLMSASGSNAGMSLTDVTAAAPLVFFETSRMALLLWLYWMNGCCVFFDSLLDLPYLLRS